MERMLFRASAVSNSDGNPSVCTLWVQDYGLEEGGSVSQPPVKGHRSGSKLGGRVQDLLRMLFDVEQFK